MVDPTAVITSVTAALKAAKAWRDVEKAFEAAGFRAQLADVIDALTDSKLALAEAKERQATDNAEIARLKLTIEKRAALINGAGGYRYAADENQNPIGFPVCPKCDQIDGRLIHLVQDGGVEQAKCPACATKYTPVSCFLVGGRTLFQKDIDERRQKNEEANRRLNNANRSWMA
jgi:soluble cytochrome b562